MAIIVFLLDTSASMNQRAYSGIGAPAILSLIDIAKSAVETFIRVRQNQPESKSDRYMLLTFDDPPENIKSGWKENMASFLNALKKLNCFSMTTVGVALKHTFDLLNLNRMQTGIDTYGQGRYPFFLEPTMIILITDGGKLSSEKGVQNELNVPMQSSFPGSGLTQEPFRWDQRLFALVLRLAATPASDNDTVISRDKSPIEVMCEVTGGRSYAVYSHKMLLQCIENLVTNLKSGVVLNFQMFKSNPSVSDSNTSENPNRAALQPWQHCKKLIFVPFNSGFWPIPEPFWLDHSVNELPPRNAHPIVKFLCNDEMPVFIKNFPYDKYQLETSPLTQYILARKKPNACWRVFIENSGKSSSFIQPFGFLKPDTNLTCVNIFIMPFNYPVLFPLLRKLISLPRMQPNSEWKFRFQYYLQTVPKYYYSFLRKGLLRIDIPEHVIQSLFEEYNDNLLNVIVYNHLKSLKLQAKDQFDKICKTVSTANENEKNINYITVTPIVEKNTSHPMFGNIAASQEKEFFNYIDFKVGVDNGNQSVCDSYRNPLNIPRENLLEQIALMRKKFFQSIPLDNDLKHNVPICEMGNYQEYLKRQSGTLRKIETSAKRENTFGNPFKLVKRVVIDETENINASASKKLNKSESLSVQKRGALPANYTFNKAPISSPNNNIDDVVATENDDFYNQVENEVNGTEKTEDETVIEKFKDAAASSNAEAINRDHNLNMKLQIMKQLHLPKIQVENIRKFIKMIKGGIDSQIVMVNNIVNETEGWKLPHITNLLLNLLADLICDEVEDTSRE